MLAFLVSATAIISWLLTRRAINARLSVWLPYTYKSQSPTSDCIAARAASLEWLRLFPNNDDAFFATHAGKHTMYDYLPPMWAAPTERYGPAGGDGTKSLLDVRDLTVPSDPRCVIYSLGGNMQTEFEEAMLSATTCNVFTFDCTVSPTKMADMILSRDKTSKHNAGRFFFEPVCLGTDGAHVTITKMRYALRSAASIMAELGHRRVDLLKMDIEGYEHDALPAFLSSVAAESLPSQISLELHWDKPELDSLHVVKALVSHGYVLVSREDNLIGYADGCTELVFALGCSADKAGKGLGLP